MIQTCTLCLARYGGCFIPLYTDATIAPLCIPTHTVYGTWIIINTFIHIYKIQELLNTYWITLVYWQTYQESDITSYEL